MDLKTQIFELFSLQNDLDYKNSALQIKTDVEFKGANVWALIFAILIASVGLNVNSTAVIIGAMLISPLMGPILGAGFGLATHDFDLVRRSLRNLFIATLISITVSCLYFLISPLDSAQSELLARTRPTLYDVLIALFGGSVGAIAITRKKSKGNILPGVAIATALMPPLCTAGFGIATGNIWFFLGALHLFLINALFICMATLGFIRLMHFKRVDDADVLHVKRARIIIFIMTLCIVIPSIYTAWQVIHEVQFDQAARRFVSEHIGENNRAVISTETHYSLKNPSIKITILGQPVSANEKQQLMTKLDHYGLKKTELIINQPVENSEMANMEHVGQMVRQGILEDLYKKNDLALKDRDEKIKLLENQIFILKSAQIPLDEIITELRVLYPNLVRMGVGQEMVVQSETAQQNHPMIVMAYWRKLPTTAEKNQINQFLTLRFRKPIRVVNMQS